MAYTPGRALASALIATAILAAPAGAASLIEEKAVPGQFSATVALTSEYYFRGISQTDDAPALQGSFDYSVELAPSLGAYLGAWGSNVDFNEPGSTDGATLEVDVYGGLSGTIAGTPLGWDLGFVYYAYPGAAGSLDYDFVEVQGSLSYDFGFASATASLNYAPEYFADSGEAYYPKLAVEVPVAGLVTLSAYVAHQWVESNAAFGFPDYLEWNLTATVNVAGFDLALTYSDTDIGGSQDSVGAKAIVTLSRSF